MAELVDALASGASVRKYVEVQVLLSAPNHEAERMLGLLLCLGIYHEPPVTDALRWVEVAPRHARRSPLLHTSYVPLKYVIVKTLSSE